MAQTYSFYHTACSCYIGNAICTRYLCLLCRIIIRCLPLLYSLMKVLRNAFHQFNYKDTNPTARKPEPWPFSRTTQILSEVSCEKEFPKPLPISWYSFENRMVKGGPATVSTTKFIPRKFLYLSPTTRAAYVIRASNHACQSESERWDGAARATETDNTQRPCILKACICDRATSCWKVALRSIRLTDTRLLYDSVPKQVNHGCPYVSTSALFELRIWGLTVNRKRSVLLLPGSHRQRQNGRYIFWIILQANSKNVFRFLPVIVWIWGALQLKSKLLAHARCESFVFSKLFRPNILKI